MKVKSSFNDIDYTKDISGIDFGRTDLEGYSEQVIIYAKRLKAQYGDKYSDLFYLSYAQRHLSNNANKIAQTYWNNKMNNLPFKDLKWLQFTYEEIILMNEGGTVIPDEVLAWAYAQQESDDTSYVVITDESSLNDLESTGEFGNPNNISEFRQNAQKGIKLANSKIEQLEEDISEFQNISETLNNEKQRSSDIDKELKLENENDKKEFKKLKEKQQNKNLTDEETERLKFLNNKLNSKPSKRKSLEKDNLILNDLLRTSEKLKKSSETNTKIAEATVKAGEYYTEIEAPLAPLKRNYDLKSLNAAKYNNLDSITTVNSIINLSNTIGNQLEGENKNFATIIDNTTITNENTNNTSGEEDNTINNIETENSTEDIEENESENENTDNGEENPKANSEKEPDKANFTQYIPSANPILTAIQGLNNLGSNKKLEENIKTTNSSKIKAKKDVQKTQNDLSKTENNINKDLADHERNVKQREMLAAQYENINADAEILADTENPEKMQNQLDYITSDIESLQAKDDKSIKSINLNLVKQKADTTKLPEDQKILKANHTDLNKQSDELKTISAITLTSGSLTTAEGGLNMINGLSMVITGNSMLSNPFTFSTGLALLSIGTKQVVLATSQLIAGPYAINAGSEGLSTSSDGKSLARDSQADAKANDKAIEEINNTISTLQKDATNDENINITLPTSNQNNTDEKDQNDETGIENEKMSDEKQNIAKNTNNQVVQNTNYEQENSDTIIAAAVTTNANITEKTTNSDKEDKKLTRFNNDSVIETKRKRNRVNAISSARGGTV